jgi:predicted RNase H-like nuclease (RuvC/YqgF family)
MGDQTQDPKQGDQIQDSKNEPGSQDGSEGKDSYSKDEVEKLLKDKEKEIKELSQKAIVEAVGTEKQKLYATIEKEKEEKLRLEKELEEFRQEEAKKKEEEEEKRREELEVRDLVKEIEEKQVKESKRFQEILDLREKEYKTELLKRDLAIFRERKIAEANGRIIPELVQGNSEEEISQSVELAKQRYIDIVEGTKKEVTAQFLKDGKIPGPDGKDKKIENEDPAQPSDAPKRNKELWEMSDEQFKEYKEKFEKDFYG